MELLHGRNAQNMTLSKFMSFSRSKIQDGSHCRTEFKVESYREIFKIRNVFLENAESFERKLDRNVPWMVLYKMCNFMSTENLRWPPHWDKILT